MNAKIEITARVVSVRDLVRLSPNLTILPAVEGIHIVKTHCGCNANICYNTAGCPNA